MKRVRHKRKSSRVLIVTSDAVDAGGISVVLAQPGQHFLQDPLAHLGGGGVVCINCHRSNILSLGIDVKQEQNPCMLVISLH